jgi:hypothetical protein
MEQSFAAGNLRPRFRKFDLAAAIVGVLLFMIFAIYDLYPIQSQSLATKAEAFRDYKRYEEKIEHTKMENNDTEMGADKNHRVEIKFIPPQQNIILSQSH